MKSPEELYDEGVPLLGAERYGESLAVFDAAIAADPTNARGWQNELWAYKGQALLKLGRSAEAVRMYEKALAILRAPETLAEFADALRELGDYAGARRAYEEALRKCLPGEEIIDNLQEGLDLLSDGEDTRSEKLEE